MDISSIVHFLTDNTRKLSSKAIFIIFALLLLLVLDNIFSFSFYYNTSQKVTQIKEIGEGLKDTTLTDLEREMLLELRSDILKHRTLKDLTYDYLTNLNFESSGDKPSEVIELKEERNPTLHLLTSAWWVIVPFGILFIALPFVLLTERKDIGTTLLGFVFLGGIGYLFSLLLSKVFSFIPLIDNNPIYNYILNFALSGIILLIIVLIVKKYKKKTITNTV